MRKFLYPFLALIMVLGLVLPMAMAMPVLAANPVWDITGSWDLRCPCTSGYIGSYDHHMDIATEDPSTGDITGSGYYIPAPYFTWVIDSGSYVSGDTVHIELHYTAGHPDTWKATFDLTIDPNTGGMAGTWTDTGAPLSSSGTMFSLDGQATSTTLTMAVDGNGTVTPAAGDHPYLPGTVVDVTAAAASGWTFFGWSAAVVDGKVTMDVSKTVTATFTEDEYTLTIIKVGNGTVDVDKAPPYHWGDVVNLSATADPGWTFAGFNPTSPVTMDTNKTVTATFTEDPPEDLNTIMAFMIKHARLDFNNKHPKPGEEELAYDDDKVRVEGTLGLDLVNGNGVNILEPVTVVVGPLSQTIYMEVKGKKGDKWEYKRPKGETGDIHHMTIDWKNGKFDIHWDKADISGALDTLPEITISLLIGDDFGTETITMKETKHDDWDYKAPKAPKP